MNASDYLRVRFQNDRQLSIYIENGFTNTMYTVYCSLSYGGSYCTVSVSIKSRCAKTGW
ncbi:hypothetical protein ABIE10_001568 [Citrobacter sp. 506]